MDTTSIRLRDHLLLLATLASLWLGGCDMGTSADEGPGDTSGDECSSDGSEQCGDAEHHDTNTIYRCENGWWMPYQDCGSMICTGWGEDDATCQNW